VCSWLAALLPSSVFYHIRGEFCTLYFVLRTLSLYLGTPLEPSNLDHD